MLLYHSDADSWVDTEELIIAIITADWYELTIKWYNITDPDLYIYHKHTWAYPTWNPLIMWLLYFTDEHIIFLMILVEQNFNMNEDFTVNFTVNW